MPTTVNSIGTQYCGKKNLHTVPGDCKQCGQVSMLSSYDTVKYFVILHLPLIPLAKLRVHNECALCQRHYCIPLEDWDEAKSKAIFEALTRLKAEPDNVEAVYQAIAAAIGFQDGPLFQATVSSLLPEFSKNHELQVRIAEGQRYFGKLEESAAAYRKALAVKDDEQVRERLATVLIRLGRAEQANAFLSHIVEPSDSEKNGCLWMLAKGFQAQGMHSEALSTFDRLLKLDPDLAGSKEFVKLRKLSERNINTGKKINANELAKSVAEYQSQSLSSRLAPWIGPMVATAILFWYFSTAIYVGQSRKVYILNGLSVPYTALINGQELPLTPKVPITMRLPEGTVSVSGKAAGLEIAESKVNLTSNFWSRPFTSPIFVINPDINAILTEEKAYYGAPGKAPPQNEQELSSVKVLHQLPGKDFVFEEFPNSIKVKANSVVSRTRVALWSEHGMKELELFGLVRASLMDQENADSNLFNWLFIRQQSDPENEQLLSLMKRFYSAQMMDSLRPQLSLRPVRINVHRLYQDSMEKDKPEHDLAAEYMSLLTADPNNGDLAYLAGRVAKEAATRDRLMQQAVDADPPVAYAASAIGYQKMSNGNFTEALPSLQRAIELRPSSISFQFLRQDCWLALQKYSEIVDWARSTNLGLFGNSQLFKMEAIALTLMSQKGELKGELKSELEGLQRRIQTNLAGIADSEMLTEQWDTIVEAAKYAAAFGDQDQLAKNAAKDIDLIRGELATLKDESLSTAHLFLYIVETNQGNLAEANKHLEQAISELRKGRTDERDLADALSPTGNPTIESMLTLTGQCAEKRVWMSALAVRFPEHQAQLKTLATKLNFDPSPPNLWLKQWLK